nr:hypothetical protein [Pseudonocardia sp.]
MADDTGDGLSAGFGHVAPRLRRRGRRVEAETVRHRDELEHPPHRPRRERQAQPASGALDGVLDVDQRGDGARREEHDLRHVEDHQLGRRVQLGQRDAPQQPGGGRIDLAGDPDVERVLGRA